MSLLWMRKNTKVIFFILVGCFLVFIFGIWGADMSFSRMGRDEMVGSAVAKVGGEAITVVELSQAVDQQMDQYRRYFKDQISEEMMDMIKRSSLDQLILGRLADKEIDRLGIRPLEPEVAQRIRRTLSGENQQPDPELVELANTNRRYAAMLDRYARQSVRNDKLEQWLRECVKISPAEAKTRYQLENEKVKIRGITLLAEDFIGDFEADEAMLDAYYKDHRDEFERPLRRKITYILFDRDSFLDGIEVTPREMEDYYDEHAEVYWNRASVRARHIQVNLAPNKSEEAREKISIARERILQGESFEDVAMELSESPNAAMGGDLGIFSRGRYESIYGQAFVDLAFALEPGELSEVLFTDRALHLVQVQERIPEGYSPLEKVRAQVEEALRQMKASDLALSHAWEWRRKAEEHGWDSLKEEEELDVKETDFFPQGRNVPELIYFDRLASLAFETGVGEMAVPQESDLGALLFKVIEERPQGIPTLEEVRDQVEQGVQRMEGLRQATRMARQIRERILAGATWEEACEDLPDLDVEASEPFSLYSPFGQIRISNFPGAGIEVAKVAFLLDVEEYSEVVEGENACFLFEVVSREKPDWEKFDVDRMSQALFREKFGELQTQWMNSLRERADAAGHIEILL